MKGGVPTNSRPCRPKTVREENTTKEARGRAHPKPSAEGTRRRERSSASPGRSKRLPEPASVHERLGEHNAMSMHRAEIVRHPANAQPQHPRGQVRRATSGQDDEPSVVGDEVQAAKLLLGQPPDPPVTGLELERASVPPDEREPVFAQDRDVANASSHQTPERQIVVRAHQRIPAPALAPAHRGTYRDLAQSLGNGVEHRLRRRQRACDPVCRARNGLSRGRTYSYVSTI